MIADKWRMFGFFLLGFSEGFRDYPSSGVGRVEDVGEDAGEDPGTLYSALYRVFCDQDQDICPLILPKVKADKPRIGKDGILPMKRTGHQEVNQADSYRPMLPDFRLMMMRKLKGMADAAGILFTLSVSYGPMFSTCKCHLQLACSSISRADTSDERLSHT